MYKACRVGVTDVIWKIGDLDMTDGGLRGPSGLKGGLKRSLKGKLNDF